MGEPPGLVRLNFKQGPAKLPGKSEVKKHAGKTRMSPSCQHCGSPASEEEDVGHWVHFLQVEL